MSILESLKAWINKLPPSLHLYNSFGNRFYRRDVYELHINYFVIVISFFHLCDPHIHPSTSPLASLIASSCLTRLYEEIDFRDDVNYLMSMNNWFLMTGCVPQLYYEYSRYDREGISTEELNILIGVLKQMGIKWPPANNIIKTVERLRQTKIGAGMESQNTTGEREYATMGSQSKTEALVGLFPFPMSMCPRMNLLGRDIMESRDSITTPVAMLNDEELARIFDEFSGDLFDMQFHSLPSNTHVAEPNFTLDGLWGGGE